MGDQRLARFGWKDVGFFWYGIAPHPPLPLPSALCTRKVSVAFSNFLYTAAKLIAHYSIYNPSAFFYFLFSFLGAELIARV